MKFIEYSVTDIDQRTISDVENVLRSGWLTTGPVTKEFERLFAGYVGSRHAIAVNSCTAALHLALAAIDPKSGDEVITSTLTFAATAEVIRYFDAIPVFIDIDPVTLNIDPRLVAKAITPKTKAIIAVDFAGLPCEYSELKRIIDQYESNTVPKIYLIEDAAHAVGAKYDDRMIGSIADITCFSFYATKNLSTGEGGMITTESDELAEKMRIMSLHGISRDAWQRYTAKGSWQYDIIRMGYKYNLTDIASAIGINQLNKLDSNNAKRREYADTYSKLLATTGLINLPPVDSKSKVGKHAWHLYIIQLKTDLLSISRDQLINQLFDAGIKTSVHFIPLHMHSYYRTLYKYEPAMFPVSLAYSECCISLPLYPALTVEQVTYIAETVNVILQKNAEPR